MSDEAAPDVQPVAESKSATMATVRAAKKRKQSERDDTLSDLRSQIGDLAALMKSKSSDVTPDVTPDVSSDVTPDVTPDVTSDVDDGPVVITKQPSPSSGGPSVKVEILRTTAVGVLGLATWYLSNVWAKPQDSKPTPTPLPPSIPRPSIPPPARAPQLDTSFAPRAKKRRVVGASGLFE